MEKHNTCEHLNKLTGVVVGELWDNKEDLACFDCGCPGPNLWICLQPDCHHVGCSEVKNDHSTLHQKKNYSHCVHMNISTERIWCYVCEKEVHLKAATANLMTLEGLAFNGQSSPLQIGPDSTVSYNPALGIDDQGDESGNDEDQTRGLVGLQNMGNTCYMNAAIQALSNTVPLTSYFLDCAPAVALLSGDKKPGLSRSYQKLIKEMWNKKTKGYVVPNNILYGIRNVHPMFRGYHQHDTQEFLRCFMDQLHEELKEPVNNDRISDGTSTDAEGDHTVSRNRMRRRAASSGATDTHYFARLRRKSPAPSCHSDSRADGYLRIHSQSECGDQHVAARHKRSASFAGTNYNSYNCSFIHSFEPEHRSLGSSSDLSSSYETCSSGASDVCEPTKETMSCASGDGGTSSPKYRSVISDVFDGQLLSSVQCLICNRVSTRRETFQDLSLPIPSREHLLAIRSQQLNTQTSHDSWLWWIMSWLRSWFYGPVVSLQDCLAAFFSADELKGDNMYSCSRCKKLRNGVKMSGVVQLPEVLCVHLKRFRHELMFSSKVGARVLFPLHDLDMSPYMHKECTSNVWKYELSSVIVHAGTAGGGHYTCIARNGAEWFHFDDTTVTAVNGMRVAQAEAYVLFYRKVNPQMNLLRQKASEILESTNVGPDDIKFFISKQWINKFNRWAEPGPIDNSDFVCSHGGVRPDRLHHFQHLAVVVPQGLWEYLYGHFGGGPACTHVHACSTCARAEERLRIRRQKELTTFYELHASFQEQDYSNAIYAISMHWFRQWQAFIRNKTTHPPPPVDNSGIVNKQDTDGLTTFVLKPGSDHAQLSEDLWLFFTDIYGGGPTVILRPNTKKKHSESDKEDYITKSETNVREHRRAPSRKSSNQSLNVKYQNGVSDNDMDLDEDCYEKEREVNISDGVSSKGKVKRKVRRRALK